MFRFIAASVAIVAVLCSSVFAATPAPQVIFDQTAMVMHFDLQAATPEAITAAFNAINPEGDGEMKQMRDELIAKRDSFAKLGGRTVTMAINITSDGPGHMVAVGVADGADHEGIAKLIADDDATAAEVADGVVLAWPRGHRPTGKASAATLNRIDAASKAVGDGAVLFMLLPNDHVRQMIRQEAETEREEQRMVSMMGISAAQANWIAAAVTVSDKPKIRIVADMPDESTATELKTHWVGLLRMGQTVFTAMAKQNGMQIRDLGPSVEALTPTANGARLTIELDGTNARTVGSALLPAVVSARKAARDVVLASNMRQVAIGIHAYGADYGGKFPPTLEAMVEAEYLSKENWPQMITHPTGSYSPAFIYIKPDVATMAQVEEPGKTPLLIEADKDGKPKPGGITVYVDGHVSVPQADRP